ncbi:MAG TPA: hypothetical protein VEH80_05360 [Candidatus Bathyarchaeia archaeon]|nr:hypothetical protein [Candidatus Bathyarchaeia archaeon]
MKTRVACVTGALLIASALVGGAASADDLERIAMARVRLTTDAGLVQGCGRIGTARDDSIRDLRRKIVRAGGNTGLLSFGGTEDLGTVYAEVFRCGGPPAVAPGTRPAPVPAPPPPPPNAPPAPPAGPPPAPPDPPPAR